MVEELADIQKWIEGDDIIIDAIPMSDDHHPVTTKVCFVILKKIGSLDYKIISMDCYDHPENFSKHNVESFFESISNKKYCISKKKLSHLIKIEGLIDLSLKVFFETGEIIDESDYDTTAHSFFKHKYGYHTEINKIVPCTNHVSKFLDICKDIEPHATKSGDHSYYDVNNIVLGTLHKIESGGLFIDKDEFINHFPDKKHLISNNKVYTEYNILTATGRPSNRFGGINYASLNKENGCRKSFISRHGNDGMLVLFDYSAYHPHIIAKLINYEFDPTTNIYEELGRGYFDKVILTEEELKKSKTITFQQLYGSISTEYVDVPFFKKIGEYINHRWEYFNEYGYVETPIFKRQISPVHLKNATPNKLFNYILQASETEYSMQSLVEITKYLDDKQTKAVLYTYDSILFDLHKNDGKELIVNIKELMEHTGFPTKSYIGKNYHDMQVITL